MKHNSQLVQAVLNRSVESGTIPVHGEDYVIFKSYSAMVQITSLFWKYKPNDELVRDGHFVASDEYEDDAFVSHGELLGYFQDNNIPEREDYID